MPKVLRKPSAAACRPARAYFFFDEEPLFELLPLLVAFFAEFPLFVLFEVLLLFDEEPLFELLPLLVAFFAELPLFVLFVLFEV